MASPTLWTWIWVNSGSWWWTGRPSVLWFMGRKESDMTEQLNWTELMSFWEEDHRDKMLFSSNYFKTAYYQHDLWQLTLTLITWLRLYLSGFSAAKLLFPHLFILYSFKGNPYVQPTIKDWGVILYSLIEKYLHKLFGIHLQGSFI